MNILWFLNSFTGRQSFQIISTEQDRGGEIEKEAAQLKWELQVGNDDILQNGGQLKFQQKKNGEDRFQHMTK